jgi:hypothetical protein
MDIKKIGISPSLPPMGQNQETKKNLDFQRILQEANLSVDASKSTPGQTAISQVHPLVQVYEITSLQGVPEVPPMEPLQRQGVRTAENTLTMLGKYQQALADPSQSLKQINPLVESLSQKVDQLQKLTQQLPEGDPLHRIIREVGVVTAAEVERFNRGDYI